MSRIPPKQYPPPYPQQPPMPGPPYAQQPMGPVNPAGPHRPTGPIKPSLIWLWAVLGASLIGVIVGVGIAVAAFDEMDVESEARFGGPGRQEFHLSEPGRYTIIPASDQLPEKLVFTLWHDDEEKAVELEEHDLSETLLGRTDDADNPEWLEFEIDKPGRLTFESRLEVYTDYGSEMFDVNKGSFGPFLEGIVIGGFIVIISGLVGLGGLIVILTMRSNSRRRQQMAVW